MAHSHSQAHAHHDHDSDESHEHRHDHSRIHAARVEVTRALIIALALTLALMVAELIGGILSNSLALLADAGHMLTDVGALGLSLFVAWMCRQPSTPQKTYGYLRWEILAALINGATLLFISAWIVWEALQRFREPQPLESGLMLGVVVGMWELAKTVWHK